MSGIVWQDPPLDRRCAPGARVGKMQAFVAELRENPGRWALYVNSTAPGTMAVLKRMGAEAVTRVRADGKFDIYARWPEVQS